MSTNMGKYDDIATRARLDAKAVGVILIIYNGEFGDGLSVEAPASVINLMPFELRQLATAIEEQRARFGGGTPQ